MPRSDVGARDLEAIARAARHDLKQTGHVARLFLELALRQLDDDHPARQSVSRALEAVQQSGEVSRRLARVAALPTTAAEPGAVGADLAGRQVPQEAQALEVPGRRQLTEVVEALSQAADLRGGPVQVDIERSEEGLVVRVSDQGSDEVVDTDQWTWAGPEPIYRWWLAARLGSLVQARLVVKAGSEGARARLVWPTITP